MPRRTPSADVGKRSIPDFQWPGIKLPVWLPTLLLPITWAADVQMAHARPFWTSALQDLSNGIKNTSRQGVLPSVVELWNCGSLGRLPIPTFGSVSLILTLSPKWGYDTCNYYQNASWNIWRLLKVTILKHAGGFQYSYKLCGLVRLWSSYNKNQGLIRRLSLIVQQSVYIYLLKLVLA
jgi:hypothetical protein